MTLEELRQKIDGINEEIIELLAKRLKVAKEIALIKKRDNLPVWDGNRESLQYDAIRSIAKEKNLSPNIIEEIFTLFIDYSRLEMKMEMGKK